MSQDELLRICYAGAVGWLCSEAYGFPAAFIIGVSVVLVVNLIAHIWGKP